VELQNHREMYRTEHGTFTLRHFTTEADYRACLELEKLIWGADFDGCVPPAMLEIPQKVGGVSAGAFTSEGHLVGMIYGLTGIKDGHPHHWSHMLAVDPAYRGVNLGLRLKLFQRAFLLSIGVSSMGWTFDPLESRNAHLNLNQLGARIEAYHRDVYGSGETSTLHATIGTDRLFLVWDMESQHTRAIIEGHAPKRAGHASPIINSDELGRPMQDFSLDDFPRAVRIEVPENIQAIKLADPALARAWRMSTRRAFRQLIARGYRVTGFFRQTGPHRCFYVLEGEA